ncbi:MAG: response regulator transcription factor [Nevskia sp.]
MTFRVLIADDHTLVRAGLRRLIDAAGDYRVIGEAGDGREAVKMAMNLRPDFFFCDISMGPMSGFETIRLVREQLPSVRCAIVSVHTSTDFLRAAVDIGASAYLPKDSAVEELDAALSAMAAGKTYFSPQLFQSAVRSRAASEGAPVALRALSARQFEILKMIARGRATKEIAYELELSSKTVESHRAQLMRKLGIRDVAGLVLFAVRNGLVRLDG